MAVPLDMEINCGGQKGDSENSNEPEMRFCTNERN